MSIGGITLSTSLVTLFNAVVLGVLISKKIKMDYAGLFKNLAKMCVAGAVTFVICMAAGYGYDNYIHLPKYVFELVKIFIMLALMAVYFQLNIMMKMDYATELATRLLARFKNKKGNL